MPLTEGTSGSDPPQSQSWFLSSKGVGLTFWHSGLIMEEGSKHSRIEENRKLKLEFEVEKKGS